MQTNVMQLSLMCFEFHYRLLTLRRILTVKHSSEESYETQKENAIFRSDLSMPNFITRSVLSDCMVVVTYISVKPKNRGKVGFL